MDTSKFELTDRANSLQKYGFFLKNMGLEQNLQELVQDIIQEKGHAKILDIGCGEAGALKELKTLFGKQITIIGIDALPVTDLDEFVQGDAVKAVFPKNCDLILSFRALHEIAHIETVFGKISESLAAGGRAFLSIRCQQEVGGKIFFHGNLLKKDLVFLERVEKKEEFQKMEALVLKIMENGWQKKEFIAGINVFLAKIK